MKPREIALQQARGGELRAMSAAVFGSVLQLAIQLGENLTWVRQWSRDERPVPDEVMDWLRRLASDSTDLTAEPLPPGWVRHIEVLPDGRTRSLPTNTRLEDRRKAIEAREAAKAAAAAQRLQGRSERRQTAYRLRHEEGLSFPKIAERIGGSYQSVMKLVKEEEDQRATGAADREARRKEREQRMEESFERSRLAYKLHHEEGLGFQEVAERLAVTRQMAYHMVTREEVRHPSATVGREARRRERAERRRLAHQLHHEQGLSFQEVADHLGVTRQSAHQMVKREEACAPA